VARRGHSTAARWIGAYCVAVAVSVLGAGDATPAGTAFPGRNGLIVFQSFRDGSAQIYTETVPPSPVKRLTKANHCFAVPAWSPDGRRIAYEYNTSPNGIPARSSDVYVMNADGTFPRRLTTTAGFDGDPAWSPDGKKIAFESTRSGNSDIWVMNADGTGAKNWTSSNRGFDGDPAWSPGGRRIAFTSTRNGGKTTDIYLLDTATRTTAPLNVTNTPGSDDFDPTWSPAGQFVAFVSNRDGNDEIYETNDRFQLLRLTNNPGFDAFPAFSPDGKLIAFSSDRENTGNRDVFYMSSDGDASGVTELTQAPGWDQAPDWQPVPASPAAGPPAAHPPKPSARRGSKDLKQAVACRAG
jgi:Tol biopolymer transport system component